MSNMMPATLNANNYAIVIVDPIVSLQTVARFFYKQPVYTIVVLTELQNSNIKFIEQAPYDIVFHSTKNIEDDTKNIRHILKAKQKDLLFVLGGCDDSAIYSENLLSALLPECANDETSYIKTDKLKLAEFLSERGGESKSQFQVTPDDSSDYIERQAQSIGFPLIIKPRIYSNSR